MSRKPLVIRKYGGTSVATAERILHCARRTACLVGSGHRVVVVVSAMGGTTDELIALAKQVNPRPPEREITSSAWKSSAQTGTATKGSSRKRTLLGMPRLADA